MSKFFYGKLAFSNLKKNRRLYLPYIITAVGVSAMYYIMLAIAGDEGVKKMPGSSDLQVILNLGCGVIGIFAVIFLFYTNSFLMKRRKKEFGLFNILGMEKRHIGKMMFWETLMIAGVSILCGAAVGIILNKLVILVLLRITDLEVPFGFSISVSAIVSMVILFLCIFLATLLYNLFQIRKAKPIELLQSASQGEAEPKTRWVMAVIGVLALGAGYGIAIWVKDPVGTLMLFFVAVILVMLGTYCLFTAGSIAVLKLMRRNKNYYYKTSHFISVSGMIYRMKQNAVGLANICILSTMVLVMVAGTVSLYAGVDDVMNNRYPKDIALQGYDLTEEEKQAAGEIVDQGVSDAGLTLEDMTEYTSLGITVWKSGENMAVIDSAADSTPEGEMVITEFMTLADYEQLAGEKQELAEDEVLVYAKGGEVGEEKYHFNDKTFRIEKYLKNLNVEGMDDYVAYDVYFVIVKNSSVLNQIYEMQKEIYGDHASAVVHYMYVDVSGTPDQSIACRDKINERLEQYNAEHGESPIALSINTREASRESFLIFCGGFLFLGVFLGFVFLMATVLIIYYKQISEGYEDKVRFEIMQKVGMSPKEVKASIRSQILKVFFLPLVMACIHLTAAFPMMNRLIQLFNMNNPGLFAICTVITVGVFAVIYGIVYGITAKAYYRIVG